MLEIRRSRYRFLANAGRLTGGAAVAMVLLGSGAALAQTCAAEVHNLAGSYNFDLASPQARSEGDALAGPATPPATAESRGVQSNDGSTAGASSGGVIRPPDTGAKIAVEPPSTGPNSMSTAPPLEGQKAPPNEKAAGLGAGQRARVESLLMAADDAASRGDETACQSRLAEARKLMGPSKSGS